MYAGSSSFSKTENNKDSANMFPTKKCTDADSDKTRLLYSPPKIIRLSLDGSTATKDEKKAFLKELILGKCLELITGKMEKGEDFFELLDPLVSDNQCQIHAVLILSVLSKCYDNNSSGYNINSLNKEDKGILSYAVLLSILRNQERNRANFVIHDSSLGSLGTIIFKETKTSKRFQEEVIAEVKEKFNSLSVEHLKQFVIGKIKEILTKCAAYVIHSKKRLKVLPCYATFHTVFRYMEQKAKPIVVSLVRIVIENKVNNVEYKVGSKCLFFYELQKDKFSYKEKENLRENDKKRPTIVFSCFSLANKEFCEKYKNYAHGTQLPSEEFLKKCDIRNLLMLTAAGHPQLNRNPYILDEDVVDQVRAEKYVKDLYEECSNKSTGEGKYSVEDPFCSETADILGEYNKYHNFARECGVLNARYVGSESKVEKSIHVTLRDEPTFFAVAHVYISNYSREKEYIGDVQTGKLDKVRVLKYSQEYAISQAQKKLDL